MTNPGSVRNPLALKVPPLALTLVLLAVMWWVDRVAPVLSISFPGRRSLAARAAMAGAVLVIAGARAFRLAGTTFDPMHPDKSCALVTTGVYSISRNPMYLGFTLALAGWALWLASAGAAAFVPLFVAWMNRFQIVHEERAMRSKFGNAYDAYRASVRRWV